MVQRIVPKKPTTGIARNVPPKPAVKRIVPDAEAVQETRRQKALTMAKEIAQEQRDNPDGNDSTASAQTGKLLRRAVIADKMTFGPIKLEVTQGAYEGVEHWRFYLGKLQIAFAIVDTKKNEHEMWMTSMPNRWTFTDSAKIAKTVLTMLNGHGSE
jgi:hypothetical protein